MGTNNHHAHIFCMYKSSLQARSAQKLNHSFKHQKFFLSIGLLRSG